jgi:hypothetical protein
MLKEGYSINNKEEKTNLFAFPIPQLLLSYAGGSGLVEDPIEERLSSRQTLNKAFTTILCARVMECEDRIENTPCDTKYLERPKSK